MNSPVSDSIKPKCFYFLQIPASSTAVCILIRPDIAWDTIFGCVEVVLLFQGGRLQGISDELNDADPGRRKIEVLSTNPSQGWKAVKVISGANTRKQRALLVVVDTAFDASATILRAFGAASRTSNQIAMQILDVMQSAMADQRLTLSHLQECNYANLDTVIDVNFVQDLQVC